MIFFKEWLKAGNDYLLSENKQEIVGLGTPKVIADILYKKFGKVSFQIAKWEKDFFLGEDTEAFIKSNPNISGGSWNWWTYSHKNSYKKEPSLTDLVLLYNSTTDRESYLKAYKHVIGEDYDESEYTIDEYVLKENRDVYRKRIESNYLDKVFFSNSIIQDIINKKILDLSPYKNLSFNAAQDKYDKKNIFSLSPPLKIYNNGWKWINVGKKCNLLGKMMRNCGSVGAMSSDKDKTMIALFDKGNKPHVVVTYSPNEKRISGDQGHHVTEVKEKYGDYVLDLANFLGVAFDTEQTKSKLLKIKSILRDKFLSVEKISKEDDYYKIIFKNGKEYYSDSRSILSIDDLIEGAYILKNSDEEEEEEDAVMPANIFRKPIENRAANKPSIQDVRNVFVYQNQVIRLNPKIRYIPLNNMAV